MRHRERERSDVDYQVVRNNEDWSDHRARVALTAGLIAWLKPRTACDPACGDASILRLAHALYPLEMTWLGDISQPGIDSLELPFPNVRRCGDIMDSLAEFPPTDVLVLTEILEHVADPDEILRRSRHHRHLVASSPRMRPGQVDTNAEHIWSFDEEGYRDMLEASGWVVETHATLYFERLPYDFQVWVCRAA